MWIYFYSLTFLKVLMLFLKASECLSDSFSKVPIGFGSGADSLNKDLQTFQKRCNRIEDVKLTLQEWSEIILVSFTRSSSSSTPSSNEEIPHHEELKNPMTLTFTVNKTTYDLPLHLHRESYKETLKITLHANETFSRSVPKNCHYFGSTWKSRRTLPISAFINLCSKTSGLILLGGETFIIKSLDFEICQQQNESSRSHIAFKIPTATDEKPTNLDSVCGNGLWAWKRFQGSDAHRAEFLRNLKIGKSKNQNNKSSHCLVIKLGLALDHSLISKLNASVEDVKQQMLLLSNILNQLLKELHKNIQIELVHLDLWKDVDLFPTSLGARWMLSSLVENARLFADADGLTFHYLHLLSGQSMDGPHYGASIPDSICTDRAVGFSYVENSDDIVSMATGIMHMLGHVIGLEHDGSDGGNSKSKKCPDHRGFAMSPKRLHYFPNMQTSSPLSLSSPNRSGDRMNKNKRNNNGSRSHDSHRHRHHHFHLGWSSCSQHEFGLNLKSRFLGCLRGQCVQHHHHHHNREQSDDAPSKGNSRLADKNNRNDGYIATAAEDNNDGSDDDDDDTSLPGGGNGFKKNFFAKCGNGILERGEECDCGSLEDCRASDPCCDHRTCLLKPWATCRKGACCTNCTLSASNHMCREMKSLCDVPEFCSGNSEECPEDSLVLDGQPCMQSDGGDYEIAMETSNATERGLCYEGRCRSYDQQCAAIWGSNSSKASDGCFSTFNQIGAISGHCGSSPISLSSSPSTLSSSLPLTSLEAEEMSSGLMPSSSSSSSSSSSPSLSPSTEFMKCSQRDAKCGLLHCKGGPQKPLLGDTVSVLFETTITSFGKSVQCKVLSNPNNPEYHLVEDGSPCSKDSMCISNKCTPVAEVVSGSHRCPRGENNLTCSGNGVCTDKLECFCDRQFSGDDCSSPVDKTEVPLTPADEFSETLNVGEDFQYYNDSSTFNKTYGADKVTLDSIRNAANALWLLGAMSCVIVGASAILILCLICYRRKTPKLTKKQQICQLRNQSLMCKSVCETSSRVNRIISFGSLPSYRADKLRKAMKGSNHSETESEKSSKRNSGEVSIKIGKEAKATYLPLPDPPDLKGILKRPESKGQRRNRAAAQEEAAANTGSDVSSIPGDSAVCGSGIPKKERVNDAKKVRNRIDVPSESSSTNQNANRSRDEGKSVRNSLATMPDILPKVSEHIKPMEVKCAVSETSKRDNSNVISQNMSTESDLKNETRSMDCEKLSKRSKAGRNVVEECSFVDGTGTMSSFLSTSDLEASPRPIAPAPSLCSEYSPQSSTTSKNAPVSFSTQPLVIPKAEQQNNLKSCANDEASSSSSSSPNSSCSTFTSSLSEALAHDPSQISEFNKKRDSSLLPSRRSADRATKYSTKEATKQTNPAGVSSCTRGESSAFLSSRTAQSCAHNQRDEMLTSLQLKNCWDTHDQSFNKSINCSSPQRLEKLSNRSRNTNADVFKPDPKGAYTKAPGSPGAPDDDDDG